MVDHRSWLTTVLINVCTNRYIICNGNFRHNGSAHKNHAHKSDVVQSILPMKSLANIFSNCTLYIKN